MHKYPTKSNSIINPFKKPGPIKKSIEQRFWKYVKKTAGCWERIGLKRPDGYGRFSINSIHIRAHRFSWELHNGPIPEGMCVLHRCDNRPCIRNSHLWLGTHSDNTRDMDKKGRRVPNPRRGENHPSAKLTEFAVKPIRVKYRNGMRAAEIARQFHVSAVLIGLIVRRKNWCHI